MNPGQFLCTCVLIGPDAHRGAGGRGRRAGTGYAGQYVAPAGSGHWQKYGDLIYRRNR
jgi:hypothetical protein